MKKLIIPLLLIACLLFTGCEPMTDEEIAQRKAEYEAWVESRTMEFEILSVSKYLKTETSAPFGRGESITTVCYAFSYINERGDVDIWSDYYHEEGTNTTVRYGDKDLFIKVDIGDPIYCLQLSPETVERLNELM